ncbi:MAG: ABC transporter substrate-binding protein [Niameybacter sp.]
MSVKKLLAVAGVGMMVLTGCSTTIEQPKDDIQAGKENVDHTTSADKINQQEEVKKENEEPLRIVSATVSATQLLDQLGQDLVGVPQTKFTLPERYEGVTLVGQAMNPDLEAIVALDSDLVVIDTMFKENVEKSIEAFGLNAFYFNTSTYSKFLVSIEELGEAIDKEAEAKDFIESLQAVENTVKNKAEGQAPTVAVLFGGGENFMLATDHSYLGDLVDTTGAVNITDDLNIESDYIPFSMEQIVASNPDYILRFAHGNLEETKKAFDAAFDKNPAFKTLDAVKEGSIVDLDPNVFGVSANIYIVDAIQKLGELFYGN